MNKTNIRTAVLTAIFICVGTTLYAGFMFKHPEGQPPKCSSLVQNNDISFTDVKLHFDLSKYSHWVYDEDRNELWSTHYDIDFEDGYQLKGYFKSFSGIMDCSGSFGEARTPSIKVSFSGDCRDGVSANYLTYPKDIYHWYTSRTLCGAPRFGPGSVTNGRMTIKSMKTSAHGIRLTWETTLTQNDMYMLELETKNSFNDETVTLQPLELHAVVTSTTPPSKREGCAPVAFRRDKPQTQSPTSGLFVVENTIPETLSGRQVKVLTNEKTDVYAPQLEKAIYVGDRYDGHMTWDKPCVMVVELLK